MPWGYWGGDKASPWGYEYFVFMGGCVDSKILKSVIGVYWYGDNRNFGYGVGSNYWLG